MLKNPLNTLPIFYLLFLIFCFSLFPLSANACNCMCSFSGGAEQYVGTASNNNCSYFWCDASKGMSGSPHCATDSTQQSGPVQFVPQIPMPGYTFDASDSSTRNIANYVKAIYKYLIGIVGITAAIMLMAGGIVWLTAGGSPERVKQAQDYIVGSLTGLGLALGSFLILATINPALVNFRISGLQTVAGDANSSNTAYCCVPNNSTDKNCRPITQAMECETGYSKQPSSCPGIAQCSNSTSANTSCCISPS